MATPAARSVRPYSRLAQTYDAVLGQPSFLQTRRVFEALVRRYGLRFDSAADVGCGTGLFARYLSRRFRVPVFAVDRSAEMLRRAVERCAGTTVRFLRQDLRCLRLPCPVGLITANFDTVNHLLNEADLRQALRRIHANLLPGGHFFFDVLTPCRPVGEARAFVRRVRTCGRQVEQLVRWGPHRRSVSVRIVERCSASRPPIVEWHRERAFAPAEVGRALLDAGFVIRGVHDAQTLRPAWHCVPRMVVLAQKRAR
jgi:SAM-dependent methyltransferase